MVLKYAGKQLIATALLTLSNGLIIHSSAQALNVTSGQLIQTMHPEPLRESSNFTVGDFFNDEALAGQLKDNIINDVVLGPAPLSTNSFTYAVHSPDFVANHPNRNPGINSFPSNFSFDPNDFMGTATRGRIGLGGVMRYDLPPLSDGTRRFFLSGDWTVEYDAIRTDQFNLDKDPNKPVQPRGFGVSGWFMRNHIDFPFIAYDILNPTIITGPDSFYFSGKLAWSPEMAISFLPEKELYRVVSDFVMCGQDDSALAANPAKQIPCVFPNITINGQTGTVKITPPEQANLAVSLGLASNESYATADYFVAFVYEGTFYWLNKKFQWTSTAGATHQGALVDFHGFPLPTPALPSGPLPSGVTVPVYFGVDSTQNGLFDEPYRFSRVNLQIN